MSVKSKMVRSRFKPTNRTFIRQWREFRGHTLEELAEMMGVTAGAISNVERMSSGYTQGMLEELAKHLHCTPGDLLERDPNDTPRLTEMLSRATPDQRRQIVEMARIIISGKAA